MATKESILPDEVEATLELGDGSTRLAVYAMVLNVDGAQTGYLRLAYGQANLINRLLVCLGQPARLVGAGGEARAIRLNPSEARVAAGYLCSFSVCPERVRGKASH